MKATKKLTNGWKIREKYWYRKRYRWKLVSNV